MTDSSTDFIRRGRCWVFGDNVCNDGDMIPFHFVLAREQRPEILKDHCMTGLTPNFPGRLLQAISSSPADALPRAMRTSRHSSLSEVLACQ